MNPWVLLLVIYAAVFLSGPLTAVFHELGHAIAYLIFTKPNSIDIFIGSYGIKEKALSFKTGKLNFYVKRSFPFVKGIGLCHSSDAESNYRNFIVILLAGPLFTLLSAAIIAIVAFNMNAHLLVLIFCYIFLGFSVLSLLSNLIPRQISRTDGISLNSDGEQIIYTLKLKQSLPCFNDAVKHFNKKEYEQATLLFKKVLKEKPGDLKILRLLVAASGMLKNTMTLHYIFHRSSNKAS